MGFLGSIFGANFNSNTGSGFQAGSAPTSGQIQDTYNRNTVGSGSEFDQLQQANAQNGFGNQSNVFTQMGGLAGQLQAQSMGQGPNPALAQLQQATGQNVANQAALMAGQRGSSANAGLMARQAAQQGAGIQQQAVGQSAIMQAQQQLAAQQALQQQQGMMANVAGQQIGQAQSAANMYAQNALGQQANVLGAQAGVNSVNAQIAQGNQRAQSGLIGGILGSVGQGVTAVGSTQTQSGTSAGLAHGGIVNYDDGGKIQYNAPKAIDVGQSRSHPDPKAPESAAGRMLSGYNETANSANPIQSGTSQLMNPLMQSAGKGIKSLFSSSPSTVPNYAGAPSMSAMNPPTTMAGPGGIDTTAATPIMTGASTGLGQAAAGVGGAGDATAAAAGEEGGGEAADALVALAKGGQVGCYADGGPLALNQTFKAEGDYDPTTLSGTIGDIMGSLAKGGTVKAMVSPGEIVLSKAEASSPKKAAMVAKAKEKAKQVVPGKAKVKGDNIKNDTVPAALEAGGIVIPRSHAMDPLKAATFAYHTAMQQRKGK